MSEKCAVCGKPATCVGSYETPDSLTEEPACDECCGHGNEDGYCKPISEVGLLCGRERLMTEPSQEAVGLATQFGHSPESGHAPHERLSCRFCPAPWPCRYVFYIDSALRAVEQRTRLETLERALSIVNDFGATGAIARRIESEIASLQPRARQCVNEGDSCCNHGPEDDAPAEPREAPKAEEPKR